MPNGSGMSLIKAVATAAVTGANAGLLLANFDADAAVSAVSGAAVFVLTLLVLEITRRAPPRQ